MTDERSSGEQIEMTMLAGLQSAKHRIAEIRKELTIMSVLKNLRIINRRLKKDSSKESRKQWRKESLMENMKRHLE